MANGHEQFESAQDEFFRKTFEHDRESTHCLFSDTHTKEIMFTKGWYEYVRCECGFVYVANPPKQETLERFYTKSRAMTEWARHKQNPLEDARQMAKYGRAVQWVADNNVQSVFDLGCGTGRFLSMLPDGIEKNGVDLNEDSLEVARSYGLEVEHGDSLPEAGSYDLISLWGVLEHVKEPEAVLRACRERLSPNGHVLVCVPNLDSFVIHTIWKACSTFCPQHLWYFNQQTLDRLMNRVELKHVTSWTIETESDPIARFKLGFDPYRKDLTGVFKEKAEELSEQVHEMVVAADNGYKIVGIYGK